MKVSKQKVVKGITIALGVILILVALAGIEEKTYIQPMEERMETELANSYKLLARGEDYKKVEQRLTEVAEDIGMEDVHISIGGNHTYGQHDILELNGHIQTETFVRKLINKTKVPFKAKLAVPILKYSET